MRFMSGPVDSIAAACLLAIPICIVLHLAVESAYSFDISELLAAIGIGLAPIGGANVLWDYGIRNGQAERRAVLAYI